MIDQLLITGNNYNRFLLCKYLNGKLDLTSAKNVTPDHLQPKRVYLHFKKIAEEIGAPDARVHDLRHTFAVLSLQNGDDVKTVQMNLGHASAAFTLDVYGHVSDRMQRESAARMEQYIASVSRMEPST